MLMVSQHWGEVERMSPARKIVNETEVLRWFEEGRSYQYMIDMYREKYNIETTQPMWANFRKRRGLDRRVQRDDELIPWAVAPAHRWSYPVRMLRAAARQRAGVELTENEEARLRSWLRDLRSTGRVVTYDPVTGFSTVPAREGEDLIRVPTCKTTTRRNADR